MIGENGGISRAVVGRETGRRVGTAVTTAVSKRDEGRWLEEREGGEKDGRWTQPQQLQDRKERSEGTGTESDGGGKKTGKQVKQHTEERVRERKAEVAPWREKGQK